MKSAQDVFDEVALHLFAQGQPSTTPGAKSCLYRGPNGLKCAVGFLIPDELYDPSIEGSGLRSIYKYCLPEEYHPHINMLTTMQVTHDTSKNWTSPRALFYALDYVAMRYRLDTDAINQYRDKTDWMNR